VRRDHEITRFKASARSAPASSRTSSARTSALDPVNLHHLLQFRRAPELLHGQEHAGETDFIIDNLRVEKDLVEA